MKTARIAISLPAEVLGLVEEARRAAGQSRSQFVVRAVEAHLAGHRGQAEAEAYARGYQLFPETPEEVEQVDQMGAAVLALEPWE